MGIIVGTCRMSDIVDGCCTTTSGGVDGSLVSPKTAAVFVTASIAWIFAVAAAAATAKRKRNKIMV